MSQEFVSEIAKKYGIHRRGVSLKNQTKFWRSCVGEQSPGLEERIRSINDVADIPTNIIADIINASENEEAMSKKERYWDEGVASDDSIILDVQNSLENDRMLFTSNKMSTIFSLKSSEGHSHSGHGSYRKVKSNTTMSRILEVVENSKINITEESFTRGNFLDQNQCAVDNIVYTVENWFKKILKNVDEISSKDTIVNLTNPDGITPLNGFTFYDGLGINMIEFMRGFYFTSLMDNLHDIRSKGSEKYGFVMGGGESHLVDMVRLKRNGIGLSDLSKMDYKGLYGFMNHIPNSKMVDVLTEMEVFLDKQYNWNDFDSSKIDWDNIKLDSNIVDIINNPKYLGQYMRESKGKGVGDDVAIYLASFLPNTFRTNRYNETPYDMHSRMMGGLMADQIDTLEKDSKLYFPGGQDEFIGRYFNELFKSASKNKKFREAFNIRKIKNEEYTLVDEDVIIDYTIASANVGNDSVHSSQRWFYRDIGKLNRRLVGNLNLGRTCALKEEVKHMYRASLLTREAQCLDLSRYFEFNRYSKSDNVLLTFKQIPLNNVLKIFDERSELVSDRNSMEEKLTEFYSR